MNIELVREICNRNPIPIWNIELNKYYMHNAKTVLINCKKSEIDNYIIKFTEISFLPLICTYQLLNGQIHFNSMYASGDCLFTDINDLIAEIKLMLL